jgi:hypothetical protein
MSQLSDRYPPGYAEDDGVQYEEALDEAAFMLLVEFLFDLGCISSKTWGAAEYTDDPNYCK